MYDIASFVFLVLHLSSLILLGLAIRQHYQHAIARIRLRARHELEQHRELMRFYGKKRALEARIFLHKVAANAMYGKWVK